jgi:hypothetical protein
MRRTRPSGSQAPATAQPLGTFTPHPSCPLSRNLPTPPQHNPRKTQNYHPPLFSLSPVHSRSQIQPKPNLQRRRITPPAGEIIKKLGVTQGRGGHTVGDYVPGTITRAPWLVQEPWRQNSVGVREPGNDTSNSAWLVWCARVVVVVVVVCESVPCPVGEA